CCRSVSRTASEIWSAILSGCPSVTDSEVNRWRPFVPIVTGPPGRHPARCPLPGNAQKPRDYNVRIAAVNAGCRAMTAKAEVESRRSLSPVRQTLGLPPRAPRPRSRARMVLLVHLLQPLAADVGIDLRGRDVRVAEHGLERPQVDAALQQMRREGMA